MMMTMTIDDVAAAHDNDDDDVDGDDYDDDDDNDLMNQTNTVRHVNERPSSRWMNAMHPCMEWWMDK